jgi:nucleoside-diphosphate-sugar epimerase
MWRPLVDVRDAADALIAVFEAPAELVKGEAFNVLHSNYQIRELAMLVSGSVQLIGRTVELDETPAPAGIVRNYECSNAKLADRLGFIPSHSVVDAVADLLERIDVSNPDALTDPRCYNIRWLELLDELKPRLESFPSLL